MQTILGSGGAVGQHLALVLPKYTNRIRLTSRHPTKVNERDEVLAANLLEAEEVSRAVEGSEIVYLTAGLEYNHKVWEQQWPVIMENVINACAAHDASLVFFDNIYMYTPDLPVPIDEETRVDPQTKKGKVRARIAGMVLKAHAEGRIRGLIARAADFYGPGAGKVSMLDQTIIQNIADGKRARWLGNPDCKHSFTYTPDAAEGTAMLGNTPECYGSVWHLPTAENPLTGREWAEMIAGKLDKPAKISGTPGWLVSVLGLFVPVMRELREMMYQYQQDYVFDSSKFEKRFGWKATPYDQGLTVVLKTDYRDKLPS